MSFLASILYWAVVFIGLSMCFGTLLSLTQFAHWFVRGWDFPRTLIAFLALVSGLTYALVFFSGSWWDWTFVGANAACILWQAYCIFPYTPLAPVTVTETRVPAAERDTIRIVSSNVRMENTDYERWFNVILAADPDVIIAMEVDDKWARELERLKEDYPEWVSQPQDNYYGMMLFSRLPLINPELRFIVQDDVPSIHTGVELNGGKQIFLHGVHPRPPQPDRDQDTTPRDAELVIVGREIDEYENHRPTIIAGDFNDVAWSHTTDLFVRLSQLLDPRKGRGLYSTFPVETPLLRFPLDHVFHSNDFRLVDLKVMEDVGSDHFPVLVELSYEPGAQDEQPEAERTSNDEEEAEEKIDRAENDEEVDLEN